MRTKTSLFKIIMNLIQIQLIVNLYLFILGVLGIITNRRHFLIVIISIEMMLLSVNMFFLLYSCQQDDVAGELFSFFILTVAAAESAIGLAIIILYYKNRGNIFSSTRFLLRS